MTASLLGGAPAARSWCGSVDEPILEETDGLPPRGARPCSRCCREVAAFADIVHTAAWGSSVVRLKPPELEYFAGRPVEDVDLLGQLSDHGGGR